LNGPERPFREAVLATVAQVPRGAVASYGQIAWMVGYPRRPRQVGMVLSSLPEGTDLPWHRIVNARGYVPSKGRWWGAMLQIERLRAEGVEVDDLGNLDLNRYLWRPAPPDPPNDDACEGAVQFRCFSIQLTQRS
jgi:methylated-DNA-protein-cysteine methyltransferase-like protein